MANFVLKMKSMARTPKLQGEQAALLNRRKSRAGKSLEHHLATLFAAAQLRFEAQPLTEVGKRPDFLFPNGEAYHDWSFPTEKLVFLGAKTTCKDRWRQV